MIEKAKFEEKEIAYGEYWQHLCAGQLPSIGGSLIFQRIANKEIDIDKSRLHLQLLTHFLCMELVAPFTTLCTVHYHSFNIFYNLTA